MRPVMLVMENVMEIASGSGGDPTASDLAVITKDMGEKIGDKYAFVTISDTSPIHHGYPTEKTRVVVVGGRCDQINCSW